MYDTFPSSLPGLMKLFMYSAFVHQYPLHFDEKGGTSVFPWN